MKYLQKIAWVLIYLIAIAFSFKQLKEPDLWWILRTGEWIVENGQVPIQDVFSFTFSGVEWINVKWIYEVIVYFFYSLFGASGILLIQTISNVLFVFLIHKIYIELEKRFEIKKANSIVIATFISLAFVGSQFRMTGRPELASHLLSLSFIFIFLKSYNSPKFSYLLIPLMVLWTNIHEAFGVGMVLLIIYLIETIIYQSQKIGQGAMHKYLAVIGAFIGVCINPRGTQMITHPLEIFGQLGENKFTTELYDWNTNYYWNQEEPYIAIAMGCFSLLSVIALIYKRRNSITVIRNIVKLPLGYLAVLAAFAYLATSAHRNIPFLLLSVTPLALVSFQFVVRKFNQNQNLILSASYIGIIYLAGLFISIPTNQFYKITKAREVYGLHVPIKKNPVIESNYLKEVKLTGLNYTDYLISSYFMWDLRPDFKSFIDLRDLDVFPDYFFNDFLQTAQIPRIFRKVDKQYDFSYTIINIHQFPDLNRFFYNSKKWNLRFLGPVCAIYTKAKLNESNPTPIIQLTSKQDKKQIGFWLSKILWPFYNQEENIQPNILLSEYYFNVGEFEKSVSYALQAIENSEDKFEANYTIGNAYLRLNQLTETQEKKLEFFSKSQKAYFEAVKIDRENPKAYYGLGMLSYANGDITTCSSYMNKALRFDENFLDAYVILAEVQNYLMRKNQGQGGIYQKKWFEYMEKAYRLDSENPITRYKLGVSYCQRNNCDEAKKYLKGMNRLSNISEQDNEILMQCIKKCVID